ncbi:MAG: GerAB/ArcD/ProY family transporter [Ignavibacteriales bacterium]
MEKNNNIITAAQFGIIGYFLGNAFFIGMGDTSLINFARQDTWLAAILAIILGLLPIAILIYIMNYKPEKNILEKNKVLFGKIFGSLINFIIFAYMFVITIILIWATSNYAIIIYLTVTPRLAIILLFVSLSIYTVIKGIEAICRTGQILFFVVLLMIVSITMGLLQYSDFNNVKPILKDGAMPMIKGSILYLSYAFTPLISLLIIPKKTIKDQKKFNRYLIGGFLFSIMTMVLVFYVITSVLTVDLVDLYRYPAYYVQKKLVITNYFNNVENFFSLHWFLNYFFGVIMSLYFLSKYVQHIFKFKDSKHINISVIILGLMTAIAANYAFKNGTNAFDFMRYQFPIWIAGILFGILLLTCILIFIRKKIGDT